MHFNVYDTFYSQYSQKHVSAAIAAICRVMLLLQAYKGANVVSCFTFMLPCVVIDFFLNNQPDALIIQIYSIIKLYKFRASAFTIIRSFPRYIRHW
jgi:hypothetical protein